MSINKRGEYEEKKGTLYDSVRESCSKISCRSVRFISRNVEGSTERGLQLVGLHYHRPCGVDYLGVDPSGILWGEQSSKAGNLGRHGSGGRSIWDRPWEDWTAVSTLG